MRQNNLTKLFALLFVVNLLFIGNLQAQYQVEPKLVIDPQGHSAMIKDITFSPDGKSLISVSDDKTIRIWNVKTGDLTKTIRGQIGDGKEGRLFAVAISPNGNLLAVGGDLPQNGIRIYNRKTGVQIATLISHSASVSSLSFSKNGKYLASGSGDKMVKVWDVSQIENQGSVKVLATLSGHTKAVYGVAFSPNSKNIVSASLDNTLRFWKLNSNASGATSKEMKEHTKGAYCVAYSPDGEYIVSGGLDGKVVLWDKEGNFHNILEKYGSPIYTVSFSHDVNKLLAMTDHGKVYLMPYGNNLGTFTKHNNTVLASAFSPTKQENGGGDIVASAGGDDNEIYLWNGDSGKTLQHIVGKGRNVWAAAFSGNNKIAFGTTHKKKNDENRGPLERTFDFASLKFGFQVSNPTSYTRTVTEFKGAVLKRKGVYGLKIGSGATIQNNPSSDKILRTYSFTKDGSVVVGSAGSLKLYSNSGQFTREFKGHTGEIWAVSVAADNKTMISASSDQTVKLWSLETGENLATLFVGSDNEWVCWTPSGYYSASAGGEKYIGWHLNKGVKNTAEFFPVHVFRDKFHIPELVKMTIQFGSFEAAIKVFNRNNKKDLIVKVDEDITQSLPPQVSWLAPLELSTTTNKTTITIKAKITSDSDITQVKVMLDGRTLGGKRGFQVVKENVKRERFVEFEVPLVSKESKIQIFAANENAKMVSDARTVIYQTNSITSTSRSDDDDDDELDIDLENFITPPTLYVLSIGVSEFANPQYNLNFADDDANSITEIYKNQEGKLFDTVNSVKLIDAGATKSKIIESFQWLKDNATSKDVVVIFIATHGFNVDGKFYILPHDGDAADVANTTINWTHFSDILGNMPSKVLLFIDTCFSGNLGSSLTTSNTEAIRELASDQNGVVIMAASTGDESSLENPSWGHGAFTLALIEGMKNGKADFRKNGVISLRELDLYVADKVDELTNGKQHPTTQKPSTISTFTVAKYE